VRGKKILIAIKPLICDTDLPRAGLAQEFGIASEWLMEKDAANVLHCFICRIQQM